MVIDAICSFNNVSKILEYWCNALCSMLSLINYLAKIYYWAKSYCHGLAPGDSYLATIYDGGVNSFLNAKMNEWIPDGDHVS